MWLFSMCYTRFTLFASKHSAGKRRELGRRLDDWMIALSSAMLTSHLPHM
jgi:hypothetical protein